MNDELHLVPGVVLEFYLGVTRCPDGIATGAFDLATRGTGINVTAWPNVRNQLRPIPWNHYRGVPYWNQEMYLLWKDYASEIQDGLNLARVREHWRKLWAAIEAVPEDEAIGEEPTNTRLVPEGKSTRAHVKEMIWGKIAKANEYASVFCIHDEHSRCKQLDCDCSCHTEATQ